MIIILGIIFVTVSILYAQYIVKYIYNYRIKNNEIQIVLFNKIPLKRIHYKDIECIIKMDQQYPSLNMIGAQAWGNRIWGDFVLIKRYKGILKQIIITPDKADDFIEEVKAGITQCLR